MSELDQAIVERFFEVYRLNRRYSEKKYGLYAPGKGQYNCLMALDMRGKLSQKELANHLYIRSTSAGELIEKLEKKKFIQKEKAKEDKRMYVISLTEKGKKEIAQMKKKRGKAHQDMLTNLTSEEKELFGIVLGKISNYYKNREVYPIEHDDSINE